MNYISDRIDIDIQCVSVSKGVKRKYGLETLHTNVGDYEFRNSEDISKLFLDIRDEAHRFALKNFRSKKRKDMKKHFLFDINGCLLYTSPSPRDQRGSRMPSSA